MKLNKKIIIVLLFIIGIAGLLVGSIAYYRIVVSGSITGSTGNAVFVLRDTEAGESWNNKVISLGQINPGDSGSFDVVMDASGSMVDMYATLSIDRGTGDTELPTNLKFYTTSDHKSELHKYYSFLEKSGTNKETLTIYWYWNPYIDDIEDAKYINKSFSVSINVNAVQISEYAMMKVGKIVIPDSYITTEFWQSKFSEYIRTITFDNDLSNMPTSCSGDDDLCWDVSYDINQNKKVYAYLVDSGIKDSTDTTKPLYNLYIVSEAPIFAPIDSASMFEGFTNLISINFNDNFNTSKVTYAYEMFKKCKSLTSLDLSNFNTSNVTSMYDMFSECRALTNLDLSSFNTSKVKYIDSMFEYCDSLAALDLSNFNTSNVTSMYAMFSGCRALTNLDLSGFNTSNVTSMTSMFSYCSSLTNLDLSSFNTSNVTSVTSMFYNCQSLKKLYIDNFNTLKITDMTQMFMGCPSLLNLDLSNFNTSKVTKMRGMFSGCSSLTTLDLSSFNTSNVTDMDSMFSNCSSLTSLNLSSFNTSNVTDMASMFSNCSSLTSLNLNDFDTSNVEFMSKMFFGCLKIQTTINIMNASLTPTGYEEIFRNALTDPNAYVILVYSADSLFIVNSMRNTASTENQSKITLKQI